MDELLETVVAEVVEEMCKKVVRKEKQRLYMQKYNEKRKEKKRLYMQKYRENKRDEILLYAKKYREENREKERLYSQKYRENNRDEILLYKKNYREQNKQKIRLYKKKRAEERNAYERKRRREDPAFKLKDNLRNRIRKALKNNTKSARSLELLGCSGSEYRKYLEDQFHDSASGDAMSWDNHGSSHGHWQIDHRVPICSFDLRQPAEQKKAFHYTNTQPLWFDAHCAKGTVVPDTHEWRDGAWCLK